MKTTTTLNRVAILLFIGIIPQLFYSCNTFYPDTAVATYIKVDSVIFTNNIPNQQTATSSKITDLWTYANNNPTGVYDVPSLYPIISQGKTLLQFTPVVTENGISNTRAIYPFYTYDSVTVNLQQNNTYSFVPHFTYRSGVKFPIFSNFDNGTPFDTVPGSHSPVMIPLKNSPLVKYGSGCGLISLTTSDTIYDGITIDTFHSTTSTAVWMELDYMCNIPFNISVTGTTSSGTTSDFFIGINPKSYWNKIYINLTNQIAEYPGDYYQIEILALLPTGTSSGQVYLDNLKVVSF